MTSNNGLTNLEGFQRENFTKFYRRLFYVTSFLKRNIGTTDESYDKMAGDLAERIYEDKALETELESFMNKAEDLYEAVSEFKTFWHLNKNKTQEDWNNGKRQFVESLDPQARFDNTNKNNVTIA